MAVPLANWIQALKGPIVVLGAGGFVGANLFRCLLAERKDVFGVVRNLPAWRLDDIERQNILEVDVTDLAATRSLVDTIKPATVFDTVAYGAYSFELDAELIYRTNFASFVQLVEFLAASGVSAIVHAGSSSEYGTNSAGPAEDAPLLPNSHYAVSKAAASNYVSFAGKTQGVPIINLRLYSVYGPYEDTSRLVPNLVAKGLNHQYPAFVSPEISRDFVFVDDVCEAFIMAAAKLAPDNYGESINIGSGQRTTIAALAGIAQEVFGIPKAPSFGAMPPRHWDLAEWYADPDKAARVLGWRARTPLAAGLRKTAEWVRTLAPEQFAIATKKNLRNRRRSISAIVACYKDEQAIPVMYERLTQTFEKLRLEYEIIFVNDGSPDESAEIIRALSARDPHVIGITHSRNFGSQMAFRSGMEMSVMQSVVLLDGDLQDPPELIEKFHERWLEGYDVVYGRRVKRDMPALWGLMYKGFYRIFAAFSDVKMPHDAGDFSLIDRRVVAWLLSCPERDLFLRGLRAFVGFRQTGVDYIRPKRMFGQTTNNLLRNVEWAKRGIFSFSSTPLKMLTASGVVLFLLSLLLAGLAALLRLLVPDIAPRGATTLLISSLFFGSINLFAVGLVGEYVAKILEEVKARPRLIRSGLIRHGEVRDLLPDGSLRA